LPDEASVLATAQTWALYETSVGKAPVQDTPNRNEAEAVPVAAGDLERCRVSRVDPSVQL
jgi:hypothetical protein